jgi:protein-S-isoprenylcysteine O-methyltransferase Ste14
MSESPAPRVRVMPPVYLLAAIVAMAALDWLLPVGAALPTPWRWLGLSPLIGGLLFGGLAAIRFRKHQTTIKPGQVSKLLMTDGPYRFTRNPIYVGMVLVLAGVALLLGGIAAWFVLPVFIWLIARNVIPVEESMLEKRFGQEYHDYRARVRRWI